MTDVAFIGLGVMGYPIAGHLAAAGHRVTVYNRTSARTQQWLAQHKGRGADTPREAAGNAAFVFACVGQDADLREVCLGEDGAFAGMDAGAIFVDHTTVSARVTRELHGLAAARDIAFVDAPVSGGQAGAENGVLSVMCGGEAAPFEAATPLIGAYARICRLIGGAGAGQITKMCNQIAIAGLLQGLAESLHFAEKSGLDGRAVIEVISQGAAGSWQMSNRYQTMLDDEFDHGFAVDWMRKDLGICLDEARENGANLPVVALVDQYYAEIQARGGGRWDTSSLIRLLRGD